MNLQIINDCERTDPGLPTAGVDPGRHYKKDAKPDQGMKTWAFGMSKEVDAFTA